MSNCVYITHFAARIVVRLYSTHKLHALCDAAPKSSNTKEQPRSRFSHDAVRVEQQQSINHLIITYTFRDGSIASLNNASFSEYSFKFYDSDAEVEEASMHGNTIFDINNVLGVFDAEIYNPM